jgi:hypothetical protein
MKITKARLVIDEQTFEPLLQFVVTIPIEPSMDSVALEGEDKYYEDLGRRFVEAIKKQTKLLQQNPNVPPSAIPSLTDDSDSPISPLANIGRED